MQEEFFRASAMILRDIETVKRVTYEMIEDYSKQNTRYLELRSTPKALGGLTKADYITAIYDVIEAAQTDFPKIRVRYLMSINRAAGVEAAREAIELAKVYNKYLVGVELSGDSRIATFSDYQEVFQAARDLGLKVTLHCACCEE